MQFPYPVTFPTKLPENFHTTKLRRDKPKVQYPAHSNTVAEQSLHFPTRKSASTNILFLYQYRDASKYKQHGEAVFSNRTFLPLDEIEKQIRACLHDGQFFIARQVNIESRFFDSITEDDHAWHEFEGVEITIQPLFDPENQAQNRHRRDIIEFLADLEQAHKTGWEELNAGIELQSQSKAKKALDLHR